MHDATNVRADDVDTAPPDVPQHRAGVGDFNSDVHPDLMVRRHDYFPFGEEVNAQPGGDARRFTGKERDAETAFDYFGARYYQNTWGRFTTADPGHVGGNIFDPQSWNAYAYARNNPLRFTDPTGTDYIIAADGGDPFWFDQGFGDFTALDQYLRAQGFTALGGFNSGYITNAKGQVVGTYSFYSRSARVFGEAGLLAAAGLQQGLKDLAIGALTGATGGLAAGMLGGGVATTGILGLETPSVTQLAHITARGARIANYAVKLSAREFQSNLVRSGYRIVQQGVGPNGPFTVLGQGERTYTIYTASSTGGPTALVRVAGQTVSKIRLGGF